MNPPDHQGSGGFLLSGLVSGSMNILGLDLSLTSTGYCHNGDTGVIRSAQRGVARLIEISEAIIDIVHANCIDVVAIEGYSFASRSGQAFSIGELGGVVRVALQRDERLFIEIPPTCRAKFATGKGNASKNEVVSAVSARTGIIWNNPGADDKCDAWILEEMVLTAIGEPHFKWPEVNLSGLDKVDWGLLTDTVTGVRGQPETTPKAEGGNK